jgi:hypothetical protein
MRGPVENVGTQCVPSMPEDWRSVARGRLHRTAASSQLVALQIVATTWTAVGAKEEQTVWYMTVQGGTINSPDTWPARMPFAS